MKEAGSAAGARTSTSPKIFSGIMKPSLRHRLLNAMSYGGDPVLLDLLARQRLDMAGVQRKGSSLPLEADGILAREA